MKIILLKDVPTLGQAGEVREVKEGYAHHYLIPRGLAAPATTGNLQHLQETLKAGQDREARITHQTLDLKAKLEGLVVEVHAKAGEGGRLFGSVTAQDIAEATARKGLEISKKPIDLPAPIQAAGCYRVPGHLPPKPRPMAERNGVASGWG